MNEPLPTLINRTGLIGEACAAVVPAIIAAAIAAHGLLQPLVVKTGKRLQIRDHCRTTTLSRPFRALADKGISPTEIAARFGVSENTIAKRLKLARVSPALLAGYRAGEMSLEQVQAFTVSDDYSQQERVWGETKGTWRARRDCPDIGGSSRFDNGLVCSADAAKPMPQSGTERTVVDCAAHLEQQIGAFSRPSHLLRLVQRRGQNL